MYECLVGYTPFYADDARRTCRKILDWRRHLALPRDARARLSTRCVSCLAALLADARDRLGGTNGLEDLKRHEWLRDVEWDHLRERPAPYAPAGGAEVAALLEELSNVKLDDARCEGLVQAVTANFDAAGAAAAGGSSTTAPGARTRRAPGQPARRRSRRPCPTTRSSTAEARRAPGPTTPRPPSGPGRRSTRPQRRPGRNRGRFLRSMSVGRPCLDGHPGVPPASKALITRPSHRGPWTKTAEEHTRLAACSSAIQHIAGGPHCAREPRENPAYYILANSKIRFDSVKRMTQIQNTS